MHEKVDLIQTKIDKNLQIKHTMSFLKTNKSTLYSAWLFSKFEFICINFFILMFFTHLSNIDNDQHFGIWLKIRIFF